MMASIDEDVEKSSLVDQDDIGSGPAVGQIETESTVIKVEAKRLIKKVSLKKNHLLDRYVSTSHSERVNPSSRSSRSGDHRRSRRDSPEYDRREGRVVSRLYSDDKDYRDRSESSPRHGRENSWYNSSLIGL